jgi:hypothetical protein
MWLEMVDLTPRDERWYDAKPWIFGRRPKQREYPLLYRTQECVLLEFVKPMDLIYK